jgi:NAD(P)-dependent dehydrogenase (short-subunit alcohol dehydrogenase family)
MSPQVQEVAVADLAGKIAIVTGASRGIGAGIAFELASRGASVRGLARALHRAVTDAEARLPEHTLHRVARRPWMS